MLFRTYLRTLPTSSVDHHSKAHFSYPSRSSPQNLLSSSHHYPILLRATPGKMTSSLIRAGSLIKDTAKKSKAQCADVVTLPQVELARLHNEITTMLKEIRVINEHVTASLAKLSNQ